MRILFLFGMLAFGFLIICIAGAWLGMGLIIAASIEPIIRWWRQNRRPRDIEAR